MGNRMRTKMFQIRLLEEEKEILKQKAYELKVTQTQYLRDLIVFGSEYKHSDQEKQNIVKQWIEELNRLGNNINQIAYNANSKKSTNGEECVKLTEQIQELLKLIANMEKQSTNRKD